MKLINKGNHYISLTNTALKISNHSEIRNLTSLIIINKPYNKTKLLKLGATLINNLLFQEAKELFIYFLSFKNLNLKYMKIAKFNLAICEWKLGNHLAAISLYEEILLNMEYYEYVNIDDWTNLSFICIENNIFDKGIKYSNFVLKINYYNPVAFDNIGQIYYKLEQYEEALTYFNIAIDSNPDLPHPYYYIGMIKENTGDYREALNHYNKALQTTFNPINTLTKIDTHVNFSNLTKDMVRMAIQKLDVYNMD